MNKNDLKRYIGITGHSLGHVEKDYFQHMILGAISRKLGGKLVFKGGTALQKSGIVTRFSEDLDFTRRGKLGLHDLLNHTLGVIRNYNFQVEADKVVDDELSLGFRAKIQGPLYNKPQGICTVRIEVSKRDDLVLEPDVRELTPTYTDILPYIIYIMKSKEILSEKVRTIYTRHRARDLYDVYMLLERGAEMHLGLANKKLKYYDLEFQGSEFLKKCGRLKAGWEKELTSLMERVVPFKRVMDKVKAALP